MSGCEAVSADLPGNDDMPLWQRRLLARRRATSSSSSKDEECANEAAAGPSPARKVSMQWPPPREDGPDTPAPAHAEQEPRRLSPTEVLSVIPTTPMKGADSQSEDDVSIAASAEKPAGKSTGHGLDKRTETVESSKTPTLAERKQLLAHSSLLWRHPPKTMMARNAAAAGGAGTGGGAQGGMARPPLPPMLLPRHSVRGSMGVTAKSLSYIDEEETEEERETRAKLAAFEPHLDRVVLLQRCVRQRLAAAVAKRRRKNRRDRRCLVQELLASERSYVESISKIEDHYLTQLLWNARNSKNEILSMSDVNKAFGNIQSILQFNKLLLEKLEKRIGGGTWDDYARVGDILEQHTPYMKMYGVYCDNFERTQEHLADCKKRNSLFRKWIEQVDAVNSLDACALLIMPVQRLPRYRMLLEEIVTCTVPGHPDYDSLVRSRDKVAEIADGVNEYVKDSDRQRRLVFLAAKMRGLGEDLVQPHRKFVLEGKMTFDRKGNTTVHAMLFTDVLVFVDENPEVDAQLVVRHKIPMSIARIKDLTDTDYLQHAIQIVGLRKSHVVVCANAASKSRWLAELNNAVRAEARRLAARRQSLAPRVASAQGGTSGDGGGAAGQAGGDGEGGGKEITDGGGDGVGVVGCGGGMGARGLGRRNPFVVRSLRRCTVGVEGSMVCGGGSQGNKPFTLYFVSCTTDAGHEFHLHKRFSEFVVLHSALKRNHYNLPRLPPRYIKSSTNLSEQVRGERQVLLDQFLQDLVLDDTLQQSPDLLAFLTLSLCPGGTGSRSAGAVVEATGSAAASRRSRVKERKLHVVTCDSASYALIVSEDTHADELIARIASDLSIKDPLAFRVHVITPQHTIETLEERDLVWAMLDNFSSMHVLFERYRLLDCTPDTDQDIHEEYHQATKRLIQGSFVIGAADLYSLIAAQLLLSYPDECAPPVSPDSNDEGGGGGGQGPTERPSQAFCQLVESLLPPGSLDRQGVDEWAQGCYGQVKERQRELRIGENFWMPGASVMPPPPPSSGGLAGGMRLVGRGGEGGETSDGRADRIRRSHARSLVSTLRRYPYYGHHFFRGAVVEGRSEAVGRGGGEDVAEGSKVILAVGSSGILVLEPGQMAVVARAGPIGAVSCELRSLHQVRIEWPAEGEGGEECKDFVVVSMPTPHRIAAALRWFRMHPAAQHESGAGW